MVGGYGLLKIEYRQDGSLERTAFLYIKRVSPYCARDFITDSNGRLRKTYVDELVKYGCVARAKLGRANIRHQWVAAILPRLINHDKNGVEDITFTLSRGTIDDFAIDNERA